jgi:DNA-binding NtrC family response regulator
VELEDLPPEVRSAMAPAVSDGVIRPLKSIERDYILAILDAKGGNRKQAAISLEIGFATLQRKLSSYRKPLPKLKAPEVSPP